MVRDFADFKYPNVFLDTAGISYVSYNNVSKNFRDADALIYIKFIVSGVMIDLQYSVDEIEIANSAFSFLKQCIIENEKGAGDV